MTKLQSYFRRYAALQGIVILLLGVASIQTAQAEPTYVGSESCMECHPGKYNDWKVSGHPYKLMKSEEARNRPIPLPKGYDWDDISYVIGGYKWKSRYLNKEGYIITDHISQQAGASVPGENQYNNMTGEWVDYHAGEKELPYNCGSCHTTGWVENPDPTNTDYNQDGLPGIHGTFEAGGIQCEECHGPGSEHSSFHDKWMMIADESSLACGGCHFRNAEMIPPTSVEENTIPASGGFIKHHEQYNELLASPHGDTTDPMSGCVNCHDSHKKSEFSVEKSCRDCHVDEAASYAGTPKDNLGVTCVDCHMPMAGKSAAALGPYKGDVKTHLFRINTDPEAQMFTDPVDPEENPYGDFVLLDDDGQGSVTMDFACLSCHQDKDLYWAADHARNFHADVSGLDLDIVSFTVTKKVSLSKGTPISVQLTVENVSDVDKHADATVTGMQIQNVDEVDKVVEVYKRTVSVRDGVGGGTTTFIFQSYYPEAMGDIEWKVVLVDGDLDVDEETATTDVRR